MDLLPIFFVLNAVAIYNFDLNVTFSTSAKEFAPDMTIISAGFDAARGDPLGGCDVCIFQTCLCFLFS